MLFFLLDLFLDLFESKNEKINLSKVILKLECLFYLNIYIYYFILFYIRRAILTQTNPKKGLIEKKSHHIKFQYISFSLLYFVYGGSQMSKSSFLFGVIDNY